MCFPSILLSLPYCITWNSTVAYYFIFFKDDDDSENNKEEMKKRKKIEGGKWREWLSKGEGIGGERRREEKKVVKVSRCKGNTLYSFFSHYIITFIFSFTTKKFNKVSSIIIMKFYCNFCIEEWEINRLENITRFGLHRFGFLNN